MNSILSSIVGGVNEQNNIVNSVRAADWTAERAIIVSNVNGSKSNEKEIVLALILPVPKVKFIPTVKTHRYEKKPLMASRKSGRNTLAHKR